MSDPRADRFVRSHLKTRHLVLLVELGRHGSLMHASRASNLTQPAASRLLAELEHAIGVQLFERLPRGVAPTAFGQVLIRRAGAALAEMDAAHQEVMQLLTGLHGRVNLGTVLTPSASLVPEAINLLKSRQPGLQVAITVDTSKLLLQRLQSGDLDMVVGRIVDTEAAARLRYEPVNDEPHALVARPGHPLAAHPSLTLDVIARQDWILPPAGSSLRERLSAMFLAQGLAPPCGSVETLALPAIANLLAGSDMLVALPQELVAPYLQCGLLTILPFELGLRMDWYGIITRRGHQLTPGADVMLAALREVAAARYPRQR